MFKQKFMIGVAVIAALVLGLQANVFAKKKTANFKVRIENVSKFGRLGGD